MGWCSLGTDAHTLPFTSNELNLDESPDLELLESLRDFTRVSSDFYPDLALHYSKVTTIGSPSAHGRYRARPGLVPSRTAVHPSSATR